MPGTTNRTDDRDHDFNMGWLGLVGLAGLLGLRRHDHRNEARSIDNTGPGGIR
jgi:MYXO-CTERM domain-containing protein